MSQLSSWAEKEQILPSSNILFLHALSGLDEAYPHWRGQSSLLSLMIQTLTACGSTLTDTLRIIVDQIPEHPII